MMGLTPRMRDTMAAVTAYLASHGRFPSQREIAAELGNANGNAQRLVACLIERGLLTQIVGGADSTLAFGSGGVFVSVPVKVAAALAAHAHASGETISDVVADAITLHLDSIGDSTAEEIA